MKAIRQVAFLAVVFVLFFAGNKRQKTSRQPIARSVPVPAWDPDNEALHPQNLRPAVIGKIGTVVPKPFSKATALRLLFPGNYYHRFPYKEEGAFDVVAWSCKQCRPTTILSRYDDMKIIFPDTLNVTEAADTLCFTDDSGKKHIIMSLATHGNLDYLIDIRIGHFESVAMGLAWFTEQGDRWVLKNFNPCVGDHGANQTLPPLHLVRLGNNNFGCYIVDGTNAPGGVETDDLYVFGLVHGVPKLLLHEQDVNRKYTRISSRWSFELKPVKGSDSAFMPIDVVQQGVNSKYGDEDAFDWADHPKGLSRQQLAQDSLNFKIVRRFQFGNGRYKKVSDRVSVKPITKH